MKTTNKLMTGLLLVAPSAAFAGPLMSHVDGYYVPYVEIDAGSGENIDEGDGWGVKGDFQFAERAFFTADYQSNTYEGFEEGGVLGEDNLNLDVEFVRAGLGFTPLEAPVYARAEYIHVDAKFDEIPAIGETDDYGDDGYGLHVGVRGYPAPRLGLYAEGGYVDVGDFGDGFQATGGVNFDITPMFGLFAEYRYMDLESDNFEPELSEARTGVRFNFGV